MYDKIRSGINWQQLVQDVKDINGTDAFKGGGSANFIKEPGLEINRPDSDTAETQENAAILIAVGPTGEVWMDGRRIDVRQVKANVVKMLADNPQGSVVIQADEKAVADTIIKVMDGAREAGVNAISLASEPK